MFAPFPMKKPIKPHKPTTPEAKILQEKNITSIGVYDGMPVKELIENLQRSKNSIVSHCTGSYEDCYGEYDYSTSGRVSYLDIFLSEMEEIDNPNLEKEMKVYEKKLKKYFLKMKEYEAQLPVYEAWLKNREEEISQQNKENLAKQIKKLEKELKRLG